MKSTEVLYITFLWSYCFLTPKS